MAVKTESYTLRTVKLHENVGFQQIFSTSHLMFRDTGTNTHPRQRNFTSSLTQTGQFKGKYSTGLTIPSECNKLCYQLSSYPTQSKFP